MNTVAGSIRFLVKIFLECTELAYFSTGETDLRSQFPVGDVMRFTCGKEYLEGRRGRSW